MEAMVAKNSWQVQEAKGRFSALIVDAEREGPQSITRHGREVAVVVSAAQYERLSGRPKTSLVDFLRSEPLDELEVPDRDRTDLGREVDL